ncbi:MAG TPA: hypothetical protein IGS53_13340 [Leptolyngbyaceae cyanobacterium M33_DOE_097]|uniref:RNase III domain-containing protein n=1 Tax=Oscillatoriales cyanobacterium SpSt-418 TaxID=2282169 RepID=A0A7C3KEK5_9CYAN|nr:hypothetical protein [Leptolyngbyaceae cyanobacterium M33_DOE_097]
MTLEEHLGYFFFDKQLLRQALTTPAYALEQQQQGQTCADQQSYALLGAALFTTVLSELLIRMGYDTQESITEARKPLETEATLAKIAEDIGVSYVMKLDTTAKQNRDPNSALLAATLTALVGAIYFDGGFRETREVIRRLYRAAFPEDL